MHPLNRQINRQKNSNTFPSLFILLESNSLVPSWEKDLNKFARETVASLKNSSLERDVETANTNNLIVSGDRFPFTLDRNNCDDTRVIVPRSLIIALLTRRPVYIVFPPHCPDVSTRCVLHLRGIRGQACYEAKKRNEEAEQRRVTKPRRADRGDVTRVNRPFFCTENRLAMLIYRKRPLDGNFDRS